MEAISAVLNQISSIEAVPLVLDTENKEEFINTIKVIHKNFGMIIIEDVTSPQSIEIEESLQDLKIPVIDTNKYGNAVVTLAGLMNIAKKEDIDLRNSRVGFLGFGSKASGITKLLKAYGVKEIKAYDIKEEPQDRMNKLGVKVEKDINDLMQSVDIVIGTSRIGGLIKFGMVKKGQIILALSKPEPEIKPEIAMKAGAKYAGDGRLINPFLAIPGLIKGTLEAKAESVTIKMMIEAAETIASYVKAEDILPGMFDEGLHEAVAAVVKRTAVEEGVAHLREFEIEEDIKDKADDIFEKIKEVNEWMTN
ncbi:MAG: NAD-dependent malic enzyme [bacterium ADurb.Bin363]|nr:MAG: NAD-dependent malic enzyme [bacterium ADurb.Bin363]